VDTELRPPPASIMKGKTFSAPSTDRAYIYAKLIRNVESAFIKLRRFELRTGELSVYLRTKDYDQRGVSARLSRSTSNAMEITPLIEAMFTQLYTPGKTYRSTTVVLSRIESDRRRQYELFDDPVRMERMREAGQVVDRINSRYGKHRIFLGTGLVLGGVELNERDQPCWRKLNLLKGETRRKRIRIPRLDLKV
jgi:hypothetical protein